MGTRVNGIVGIVLAWLWAPACSGWVLAQRAGEQPIRDIQVSWPDLSSLKEPIRRRIELLQAGLVDQIAAKEVADGALGQAFGELAIHYHAHNLLDAAERVYAIASKLAPKDIRWPYYLGFLFEDKSRMEEAAKALEKVVSLAPDDFLGRVRLGFIELKLNRPERARATFQKALEQEPYSAFALKGMADAAMALGDPKTAVERYEEALVFEPSANSIHYPLGLAYRKLGEMDQARHYLQSPGKRAVPLDDPRIQRLGGIVTRSKLDVVLSMGLDTDSYATRDVLGYLNTNLRGREGLIRYLSAALADQKMHGARNFPGWARIHYLIGGLLQFDGREDEALEELQTAVKLAPAMAEPYLDLAGLFLDRQATEKARAMLDRLLQLEPDSAEARFARARVLLEISDDEGAERDLRRLVELRPDDPDIRFVLASLQERLGLLEAVAIHYRAVIEMDVAAEKRASAYSALGKVRQVLGDIEGAVDLYQRALELAPGQPGVALNLASALAYLDRFDEAVLYYEKAIADDPRNEPARFGQIAALFLTQRFPEAKVKLEAAALALPQSRVITHLRARLLAGVPRPGLRDGPVAAGLARMLYQSEPNWVHAETYAMALAQQGDYQGAAALQREWLLIAVEYGDAEVEARLKANLDRYKNRRSCCADDDPYFLLPPSP